MWGRAGIELCELLPQTATIADDLLLVRSMVTGSVDQEAALRMIHSGRLFAGMPSLGSWVTYALGTENQDLPAFVVLSDPGGCRSMERRTGAQAGCQQFTKARYFALAIPLY